MLFTTATTLTTLTTATTPTTPTTHNTATAATRASTPSTHSTRTGRALQVLARHCGLVVYMAFSHEVLAPVPGSEIVVKKKCEKRAAAGERQAIFLATTAPFPKAPAS